MKKIIYSNITKALAVLLLIAALVSGIVLVGSGIEVYDQEDPLVYRFENDFSESHYIQTLLSAPQHAVYAVFQLWLGLYHRTFWFFSLGAYYVFLAVMRASLARFTGSHRAGEEQQKEWRRYRACGWILLFMNLALSLIIFFMVYWNRTFLHHEITTIAMAAYTFTAFTAAIVNIVKYRKYNSPVYSASKAISLAAACVSMLTLSSTMLTTFGEGTMSLSDRRLMLGGVGGAVAAVIITMAVAMIVKSGKELKREFNRKEPHHGA